MTDDARLNAAAARLREDNIVTESSSAKAAAHLRRDGVEVTPQILDVLARGGTVHYMVPIADPQRMLRAFKAIERKAASMDPPPASADDIAPDFFADVHDGEWIKETAQKVAIAAAVAPEAQRAILRTNFARQMMSA